MPNVPYVRILWTVAVHLYTPFSSLSFCFLFFFLVSLVVSPFLSISYIDTTLINVFLCALFSLSAVFFSNGSSETTFDVTLATNATASALSGTAFCTVAAPRPVTIEELDKEIQTSYLHPEAAVSLNMTFKTFSASSTVVLWAASGRTPALNPGSITMREDQRRLNLAFPGAREGAAGKYSIVSLEANSERSVSIPIPLPSSGLICFGVAARGRGEETVQIKASFVSTTCSNSASENCELVEGTQPSSAPGMN